MKKFIPLNLLVLAAALFFAACEDESPEVVDTTAPTIANVSFPAFVEPGEEFEIQFTLSDDVALEEVRIDIHPAFDDHEHEGARLKAVPYEATIILDEMQGQETFSAPVPVSIPQDAATGPYHLQINYFDAAGNEGELFVGSFEIVSESISPAINITNFGPEEELNPNENGILELAGIIESKTAGGLAEVHIMVVEEEEEHSHGRLAHDEENALYDQDWELDGATSFVMEEQIEPAIDLAEATADHYELRIMALDMEGNVRILRREIHME